MRKLLLLVFFAPAFANAQTDTSAINSQLAYLIKSADVGQDIYNGEEHLGYVPTVERNAYYLSSDWQPGNILYRGIFYPSVFLKYDLIKNQVLVRHSNGYTGVILFTPRIQRFSILEKNFVRVEEGNSINLSAGIYEQIVSGKVSLYAKRAKHMEEYVSQTGVEWNISETDRYYLLKDGTAFWIKKDKNILDLLKDKKAEIKKDLKQKGFSFKHNREATLTEIVTYYNESVN